MKSTMMLASLIFATFVLNGDSSADDKEVTLTGKIACGRCSLKEAKTCQNVILVKEGDKTVNYYLLDKGAGESYHSEICGSGQKDGRVIGTVSEKDGKKWITPKKVEYLTTSKQGAEGPRWNSDYALAMRDAKQAGKPLALFFASGPDGWKQVLRDGAMSDDVANLLERYVPVYLDTATPNGKALASAFDVQGVGLILSDHKCEVQAFCHQGALGAGDLASCLTRCCTSAKTAAGCANGACATGPAPSGTGRVVTASSGGCCGR